MIEGGVADVMMLMTIDQWQLRISGTPAILKFPRLFVLCYHVSLKVFSIIVKNRRPTQWRRM